MVVMLKRNIKLFNCLDKKRKANILFVICFLSIITSTLFYDRLSLAFLFLFLFFVPVMPFFSNYYEKKRKKEILLGFKDLLYSLSASFQTGRMMTEALLEAEESLSLIYKKDEQIMKELHLINEKLSKELLREEDVLISFAKRSGQEDILNFFTVYFTCKKSGGDIAGLIDSSAKQIISKIEIEDEIKTLISKKKFESKILGIVPIILLIFLRVSGSEYLSVMYDSLYGVCLMSVCVALLLASFYLSERITDVEV
jgi:tight adherence protein B